MSQLLSELNIISKSNKYVQLETSLGPFPQQELNNLKLCEVLPFLSTLFYKHCNVILYLKIRHNFEILYANKKTAIYKRIMFIFFHFIHNQMKIRLSLLNKYVYVCVCLL